MSNGLLDCITSVFDFHSIIIEDGKEKIDRSSIEINHVLFDLDQDTAYDDMLKLYSYAKQKELAFRVIFSGKGFHFYFIVNENSNTIDDVKAFQLKLIQELSLNVDPTNIGNAAGMIRIPGSFNLRRGKWCISLRENELSSHEKIKELANKQRKQIYIIKGNKLELDHFQTIEPFIENKLNSDFILSDIETDYLMVIPCLRMNMIQGKKISHQEKIFLVQYLSELYRGGIPLNQLSELQKKELIDKIVSFFEPIIKNFKRYKTKYYVEYIVRKYDNSPSCEKLKSLGFCVGNVNCWRR